MTKSLIFPPIGLGLESFKLDVELRSNDTKIDIYFF